MFATLSSLALFVSIVSALTIQTPTNWQSGTQANVSWTNAAGDPSTWSLELSNPDQFHNTFALANNVNPSTGFASFELPVVPAGSGYVLQAVDITNVTDVFAQSGDFSIAPTPSTLASSSSSASSALSSGASSVSLTSGASSASTTSGFGSTVSAGSSAGSSASGGSTGAAQATTSPSSTNNFNGAVSTVASWGVLALAAVGGAIVAL